MKQRIHPPKRRITVLLALLSLAFATGCNFTDPVVSVGSPSPSFTQSAAPTNTAVPETPTAKPQTTPQASAEPLPSASPGEANGAGAYTIATDVSESKKTYYSEHPDENALRVENSAIAGVDGASVEKRAGDADSLLLSAGKADAVLSDSGIQPFRKRAHMLVQLRLLQCSPNLLIINILIRDTKGHILPDGCIQHIN